MTTPVGPYTPIVRAGEWLIVSGQLGQTGGKLVAGGIGEQTTKAVANLAELLGEHGASLAHIAKTTCFLADIRQFADFNEAYVAAFGDHRPARSTIEVAALPMVGALVEIEAWAHVPAS
jgi:2-iminobutanoate/2-iminopropanoate deaminase